jgi:hypothetical protein
MKMGSRIKVSKQHLRNVITLDQQGLENRSPLNYIPGEMVFEYWPELRKIYTSEGYKLRFFR